MSKKVLFKNSGYILPFSKVQYVELRGESGVVVMDSSRYNFDHNEWETVVWLTKETFPMFIEEWEEYLNQQPAAKGGAA